MSHQCTITIDNTQNPCDLVLQSIPAQSGNFSTSFSLPYSVPKQTKITFTIINDSDFDPASATMTWTTGGSSNYPPAQITLVFENDVLYNNATLSVDGTSSDPGNIAAAKMAYGVSYFYASEGGTGTQLTRDSINTYNTSHSPVTIIYSIVPNTYVVTPPANPSLPGITNVIMLMLENRSLDHLLGQAFTENNPPSYSFPPGSPLVFDGLGANPTFANTYNTTIEDGTDSTTISIIATASPVSSSLLDVPNPDPGEGWVNTNTQLFYPNTAPPANGKANMLGFLADYFQTGTPENPTPSPAQIMQFYTPAQLPVINTLAQNYAVSDAWFASVPSETSPNRGFSLGGTSAGFVDNTKNGQPTTSILGMLTEGVVYSMNTIFNILTNCGLDDWAIYYQEQVDSLILTTTLFDQAAAISNSNNTKPYASFLQDMQNGNLPAFSYLEPSWFQTDPTTGAVTSNGNDYHPFANLCSGEQNLAAVYNAISNPATNPNWATTLFIVTFDEHGGTLDHVSPPETISPDGNTDFSNFQFDRLGVRVPTILISPMINAGTVFRSPDAGVPFDHTSFIKTILGWKGIDISGGAMGARAAQAPDFSGVLDANANNSTAVKLNPPVCPASMPDVELNGIQKLLMPALAQKLSGSKRGSDEHKKAIAEMESIKTIGELNAYVKKVKSRQ